MIIKVKRGSDFQGLFRYLLRHGQHGHRGEARIIAMAGVYDERTAAAQMAYNAALAPERAKPVVHLIARAETGISDERNVELAEWMIRDAGLAGRPYVAVAHDDGHLHVAACEIDDEGKAPDRILWSSALKKAVSPELASTLPPGSVRSRAWDSHISWRMSKLARQVEKRWDLRRLSSAPRTTATIEPRIERWQDDRLRHRGQVPLQDRYFDQVRRALTLPTWQQRVDALALHGLEIRVFNSGTNARGLRVCSMSNDRDFAKISDFGLGGMRKLDASADQTFVAFCAGRGSRPITLAKPEHTFDPVMRRVQVSFRHELKEWHRTAGRRRAAFDRYKRSQRAIGIEVSSLTASFADHMSSRGRKAAECKLKRELLSRARAELDFALREAGPARTKPSFADFVQREAELGNTDALRVRDQLAARVSETQRRRCAVMALVLSRSLTELKARAAQVHRHMLTGTESLKSARDSLLTQTKALQAEAAEIRARNARRRAHEIAEERRRAEAKAKAAAAAQHDRLQSEKRRIDSSRSAGARFAAWFAQVAALMVWLTELKNADLESKRLKREQAERLARERERIARERAEAENHQAGHAIPVIPAAIAEHRHQPLANGQSRCQSDADCAPVGRTPSQAAPERPRDPLAAVHAQRASLWAALVHDDDDSPATREYLYAWSAGLNAIPTDRAITRADLVAIETMVILELARGGRGIAVIEKIAISRSPTKEHARPIFLAAMDNQIVRDTLAEQGVKALRREAKIALYNRDPQTDVGEEFVTYWAEIIDELPIDLSLPPEDYFRAIDFDVAQVLVKRGHPISGVAEALAVHSPSVEAKDWQSRGEYLEDVLADLAERQGLVPGWAKAVIAAASTGDQSASPAVASSSYAVGAPGSLTGTESIAGPMRQQIPSQQERRPDLVDPVSRQDPKRPPAIADARRLPPDATLGPSR